MSATRRAHQIPGIRAGALAKLDDRFRSPSFGIRSRRGEWRGGVSPPRSPRTGGVKSRWVYRKLRNFRAGIEAGISCMKRAYGLACCTWRGLDHFKTYIWSAVVAHNLVLFARLKPA